MRAQAASKQNIFRRMTKGLGRVGYSYHNYCLQKEKSPRVVVQVLPTVFDVGDIKEDLLQQRFLVHGVVS